MPLFLTVHTTYTHIQIGIFKNTVLVDYAQEDNKRSSQNFIPLLHDLLTRNNKTLADLAFIAAYQGPGPFTTLRVSIASVNGLGFATQLPLVGVDGLDAFLEEQKDLGYAYTIALLNAFSNDVYVGIYDRLKNTITYKGYRNIAFLLEQLAQQKETIKFVGNGTDLYSQIIQATLGDYAYIPELNPAVCSLESVAKAGLSSFQIQENCKQQLLPLYLKNHPAQQKAL
jgi:tRNA threonylcarbamoyladenosine biosynthesis protein TsaB